MRQGPPEVFNQTETSKADRSRTSACTRQAVAARMTALGVLRDMLHGLDYMPALNGSPADRLQLLTRAVGHVLTLGAKARTPPSGRAWTGSSFSTLSRR